MATAAEKLFEQATIEKAQDLCQNKFMILMPWYEHMRGPFNSEDEAFDWLRKSGWSRSGVQVFQVTHPKCRTSAE